MRPNHQSLGLVLVICTQRPVVNQMAEFMLLLIYLSNGWYLCKHHRTDKQTTHGEVCFWVRLRHIAGIFMISKWELMLRVLQSTTYQKHYTSFSRSQPIHYCMLYFTVWITRSYKPFHGTLHFISTQYHTARRALSLSPFCMQPLNRHLAGTNFDTLPTQSIWTHKGLLGT